MKILAISDIHGKKNENLINYLKEEDISLVLLAGDITNFGPLEFVNEFIGELLDCNVEVFAIYGNCDIDGVCEAIGSAGGKCIHNKIVEYEDIVIMGYGGSNPTPFDTPGETDDENICNGLYGLFEEFEKLEKSTPLSILLTHAPPYNTNADTIESGVHVGSEGVEKIIKEFQPTVNICGHIHEAISMDTIGATMVVNPGMLEENHAILLEVDEKSNLDVNIIDL